MLTKKRRRKGEKRCDTEGQNYVKHFREDAFGKLNRAGDERTIKGTLRNHSKRELFAFERKSVRLHE